MNYYKHATNQGRDKEEKKRKKPYSLLLDRGAVYSYTSIMYDNGSEEELLEGELVVWKEGTWKWWVLEYVGL